MDDPMAGTALPGPPHPIRAPLRAPGYPAATPADHGAHQMQAGVAARPVHAAAAPAAGDAQTDEAKRSTVDAAVPVFMRDFPDFCETDCRAALDNCYRADMTIQLLIEAAFEHLVAKLTGAPQEEQPPDPQHPQQNAAAAPDPNDEEEAFRQETMQMRQAMHMSEVDNAAHRNHEKPMYQWAAQDFQDHFPRSAIVSEIAKHCKGAGIDSMCTKESSCELQKLLKNEQHSQRWYKTERGLHGYWMTYATEIVRVASGLITIEAPSEKQGTTNTTSQKSCRAPNRKRRLQSIEKTAAAAAASPQPTPKAFTAGKASSAAADAVEASRAPPQPKKKSKTSSRPPDSVTRKPGCRSSQRSSRSGSRSRSLTPAPPAACASMHASGSHTNNKEQGTDKDRRLHAKASARPAQSHETQGIGKGNGDANGPRSTPAKCASPPPAADACAAAHPTRRSKRIRTRTDSVEPSREASEEPGAAAAAAAAASLSRGSTPRMGEAPSDRGSEGGGPRGGAPLCTTAAAGRGTGGLNSGAAVGHKPSSTSQQGRDLKGSERSKSRDTAARTGTCSTAGGGGGNENGRHHQSSHGAAEQQQARNSGAAKADEHRIQHAGTQGCAPGHERNMQDQGTAENAGSARDRGAKSRQVVIAELVQELKRLNRRFEKEVVAVAAGPEKLAAFVPFRPAGASEEEWGGVKVRRSKEGSVQIEIDD